MPLYYGDGEYTQESALSIRSPVWILSRPYLLNYKSYQFETSFTGRTHYLEVPPPQNQPVCLSMLASVCPFVYQFVYKILVSVKSLVGVLSHI